MKYCLNTTINHPLSLKYPLHVKEINKIIEEESKHAIEPQPTPFNVEVALKLDKAKDNCEDQLLKGMGAMDMVLGMKDSKKNKVLLLVDFKLNCRGTRSLREGEFRKQIKDSRIILFGSGMTIYPKYVFIFTSHLLQESKSVISRMLASASCEILTIDELKSNYF